MKDIMIDMETLGINKRTVLLDIGLVMFDINTGEIGEELHVVINRNSQLMVGRAMDQSTINWWVKQSGDARSVLDEAHTNGIDFEAAIQIIDDWLRSKRGITLWSNGANFDIAILEECFWMLHKNQPWQMWKTRCVRTLHDICKEITGKSFKKTVEQPTIAHNSIEDCKYQIRYCVEAYKELKNNGK